MIAAWWISAAFAADPMLDALVEEMTRETTKLSFADAPPIYHARYHLVQLDQADAYASFGEMVDASRDPYRTLGIELRIGTPQFDNTGFGGWQNGFDQAWLPRKLTPQALQIQMWRTSDGAYKEAVEQYARKQAQFSAPPDYPGDYTLTGPITFEAPLPAAVDGTVVQALAQKLSAVFPHNAAIDRAEVYLGQEAGEHIIVDTEGSRIVLPMEECTLRAIVQTRAADGQTISNERLWTVRRPEQLPTFEDMEAELKTMIEGTLTATEAKPLSEEYVGPVIFEGDAALDLFRWLLVPQLEGTPPEVPFDSWFGEMGGGSKDSVRMERRVLPPGWHVNDNPQLLPDAPSAFTHDNEGTPAQDVALVDDGIVREVLMSRVPRTDLKQSNGHARGSLGERAQGRAAQMVVEPPKHLSDKALQKRGLKLARAYGRDWVVIVRELQDPAGASLSAAFSMFASDDGTSLPPPVAVFKHYADGHEEELRGGAFTSVHRWVLRDIVAAGREVSGHFMASPDGGTAVANGPTGGIATYLRASNALIGEMELIPTPGDPRDVPVVPPPQP